MGIVVRNIDRLAPDVVAGFESIGVATVHEAQGRTGLLDPAITPIYRGAHVVGSAVTVSVPPDDNWMIHVAVEQCREGDVLVVAPTSPSSAGYFGELLATALAYRGVRGLVIDAGCRDVRELEAMDFPVWSRHVSAQGTVKAELGDVNVPMTCAGQAIAPGDLVLADDDGVVVVTRQDAARVLESARRREEQEAASRASYAVGELSLDRHDMRGLLAAAGLAFVDTEEDLPAEPVGATPTDREHP